MSVLPPGMGIKPDHRPEVRIRMGRKADGGGVTEKDRFHLCCGRATGSGQKAVSDPHPSFAAFNGAPPERRRELRGNLNHATWTAPIRHGDGCVWSRFDAQRLAGHDVPPGMHPACSGDGQRARRWTGRGSAARWVDITCPGDACEFRTGDTPACKRGSTLVFQLRWREEVGDKLPAATAFIESAGPWSYATMQWWGFYAEIEAQWKALGLDGDPDLYGLPIRLSLQRRTVPGRGAAVYVPELYPDFPPGQTLQDWLAARVATRRQLTVEPGPVALLTMGARATVAAVRNDDIDADFTPVEPPARGGR